MEKGEDRKKEGTEGGRERMSKFRKGGRDHKKGTEERRRKGE